MPIPDYQSCMLPLLKYACDGQEHQLKDAAKSHSGAIMITNRGAIQSDVEKELNRTARLDRLAQECSKLDPRFEKLLAEEGLCWDVSRSPKY